MAWAAALVGLPCLEGGPCGVEGWLAGTRVVTGSASCEERGGKGPGQVLGAPLRDLEGLVAGGGRLQ